jgi:hypothetical protein
MPKTDLCRWSSPRSAFRSIKQKDIANLLHVNILIWQKNTCRPPSRPLGPSWEVHEVLPGEESFRHLATVCGGGEKMASQPEVLSHETVGREETLNMTQ